jgi:hypothetical protein
MSSEVACRSDNIVDAISVSGRRTIRARIGDTVMRP